MHGRGRVCDGRHLIGIVLLPPVEWCRDITADEDLADILPVIGAGETETLCEGEIIRSQHIVSILVVVAVGACPGVQWIPGTAHRVLQIHHGCSFDF